MTRDALNFAALAVILALLALALLALALMAFGDPGGMP